MTVRGNVPLSFCRILVPPNAPQCPPPHDSKILYYLMTEMKGAIICVGFWRPSPLPDATILNYPNDREMGALLSFVGFWRPPNVPPPPDATILNYLTDREEGGHYLL